MLIASKSNSGIPYHTSASGENLVHGVSLPECCQSVGGFTYHAHDDDFWLKERFSVSTFRCIFSISCPGSAPSLCTLQQYYPQNEEWKDTIHVELDGSDHTRETREIWRGLLAEREPASLTGGGRQFMTFAFSLLIVLAATD